MPTAQDYANQAAVSADNADASALVSTTKAGEASASAINALASATDAYVWMLNSEAGANSVTSVENNVTLLVAGIDVDVIAAQTAADLAITNANISTVNLADIDAQVIAAQLAETNAELAETNAETAYTSLAERYLGSLASDPVTIIEGAIYWNSVSNLLRIWNGSAWEDALVSSFDGVVNGGTTTRVDTIQLRGDTSTNWTSANPILLVREIGLETNTGYIKVGDGSTVWNSLSYIKLPKASIDGISNVDNTSDVNKPVSTAQATADNVARDAAKAYADTLVDGVFKDMGSYDPSITNQFPIGTILQGYVYTYSNTGTQGSVTVSSGDQVRAKIDVPGQTEANWLITPKFDSSTKPYIVCASPVYGRPLKGDICISHKFVLAATFPINLTGSNASVKSTKKATNTATFTIKKNDIQIGTIVFTSASTEGTFTFTNAVTFNVGDVLDVYAPNPADPTLADIIISLYGTR